MVKPHLTFLIATPAKWLRKSLEILLIAIGLVIGMYDPIPGQEYEISSFIQPESLTVGDKFLYVNTIKADTSLGIKPADITDRIGDADLLSDVFMINNTKDGDIAYACTLAVYKPGEIEIPSFTFEYINEEGEVKSFTGNSLKTEIYSILPSDSTAIEIADIKEPRKLKGPIWPYIVIPLVIGALIALGYYLRKRFAKDIVIPGTPQRPPWDLAIEELNNLKIERHHEFGRYKIFYFELSLILRNYIERRYDFPAAESTTYELENEQELKTIDSNLYSKLFELLDRSDMTKFAKFNPTQTDADIDMKFSYNFVGDTIPEILIEDDDNKKEDVTEDADVQV